MARPRVLIPGGYGVFGRLLARELLATTDAAVVIAGRDPAAAARACRALDAGERAEPLGLDLADGRALAAAAAGCFAVACAAGPFQGLDRALPGAAVAAGAHWLDIADDPGWVGALLADRELDRWARAAGVAVLPGLSTVPALSGVLARRLLTDLPGARKADITLFIGNRNAKGAGAIASALGSGFRDPVPVETPLGDGQAYRFASPDEALFPAELGLTAAFRVGFQWGPANLLVAALQPLGRRLSPAARARLGRWLSLAAAPFGWWGSDAGCLQVRLSAAGGRSAAAALVGQGQRMAVLPCALALQALLAGELAAAGVASPASLLPQATWLARLDAAGLRLVPL